jgi:hypothetical protein
VFIFSSSAWGVVGGVEEGVGVEKDIKVENRLSIFSFLDMSLDMFGRDCSLADVLPASSCVVGGVIGGVVEAAGVDKERNVENRLSIFSLIDILLEVFESSPLRDVSYFSSSEADGAVSVGSAEINRVENRLSSFSDFSVSTSAAPALENLVKETILSRLPLSKICKNERKKRCCQIAEIVSGEIFVGSSRYELDESLRTAKPLFSQETHNEMSFSSPLPRTN